MTGPSAPTRTRRFLGGLSVGYVHTALVAVASLWLTPYLLRHLGQHDYGLWLLASQLLLYLGLMDLGVVALLPREVAYASGLPDERREHLRTLVGHSTRIVLWQTPVVVVAGLVVWWFIPAEWEAIRRPLLVVVLAFVAAFPFRIFQAVLQGLQDLSFVGATQVTAWGLGTAVAVVGIMAGLGLYSLAAAWVVTQALSLAACWLRLKVRFPTALPTRLPSLTLSAVRLQFGRGVWISVAQVAQALVSGTDLLVIGTLLGAEAVVPYACTSRLVMLLGNQPQLFMEMALPALSELRAAAPRRRLFEVSTSMTQMMLLLSGGVVSVVLVVNEPFVTWWVGAPRYAGFDLTLLFVVAMVLRHWNITTGYTLFCFGYERRLALTAMAEGLVAVAGMMVLVPLVGLRGAVLASLIATCAVALPVNLRALLREQEVTLSEALTPLRPWLVRFAVFLTGVALFVSFWRVQGILALLAAGSGIAILYGIVMWPTLFVSPLGPMVRHQLQPLVPFVPGLARRLAGEGST